MSDLYRFLARSEHPAARTARGLRQFMRNFSVPAPRIIVRPMLWTYLALRTVWHFFLRVFICEPIFKAYCKQYGRGVHTDVFIHWITGKGDIILGDNVLIDGKSTISFAARLGERPTLLIGDRANLGHNCHITVAERITIGAHTQIASDVWIYDSPGHPSDPDKRRAFSRPGPDDIRPVTIGNNVWIGRRSVIMPGVTIGDNSIVGPASVVTSDVPANTVVLGNPARKIAILPTAEVKLAASGG